MTPDQRRVSGVKLSAEVSMRRDIVVAFVLLGLLVMPRIAAACSCMQAGPACQAFWKTDAVFDATVDAIERAAGPEQDLGERRVSFPEKLVRVTVRTGFKGVTASGPLEVYTATDGAACGYDFKVGHRYLVFAWQRPADGRWVASLCSATQEYDGTGPSAAFLASFNGPSTGARVFGAVKTFERHFDRDQTSRERTVAATVHLSGGGKERTTISRDGSFEFPSLEPGRYELRVDVPTGFASDYTTRNIDLPDPRACQEEAFSLAPAGRVSGVVVDADGRPARNVHIELTGPDTEMHPDYGLASLDATTRSGGEFEIAGVPPGRYILGVNLRDLPSPYNPYARTLYPSDGGSATILEVGSTGIVDVGTWKLPPVLKVVRMAGVAVDPDGRPAAGIYVGAWDVTGNPVERARGAGGTKTSADGTFTLELREGRSYTFMARDAENRLLQVHGPRVTVGTPLSEPIRLTIQRQNPRTPEPQNPRTPEPENPGTPEPRNPGTPEEPVNP
jgi:hypothetical protein